MEKITSRTNDKIKYAVRLGESASLRKESGEFFLEGARLCSDAALTGIEIRQAFFTGKALWKYADYVDNIVKSCGICYEISAEVSQKLAGTEKSQGVFCICAERRHNGGGSLDPSGKYLALENLQDPANLGAICRSAEALGLDGLIVGGGCDIYNPKALRAAMGSSLRLNIISAPALDGLIDKANSMGMLTLASVPRSTAVDIRKVSMGGGVICCVGNEGSGLSEQVIEKCKMQVVIPMNGRAESFNAAAAAAILAWELKR
ncbi:MAG: RNA methyltransferase [Oscillospiraceae bacterium]|nr:RNA methyltransferase [Oscillospiraceae bacterium]